MNAKRAWSKVRIGLRGPFELIDRLRHRDRRRPRRGHRAVRQGQHRPPPGGCEVRKTRAGIRLSGPRPQGALGRGLVCAGEGRPLGRGTAGGLARCIGHVADLAMVGRNIARRRVWQWTRAAPGAANPSAGAGLPIYAERLGKPAWARRWGWVAGVPIHKKAPPVAWPASLGSKARRPCMRGEPNPATWET